MNIWTQRLVILLSVWILFFRTQAAFSSTPYTFGSGSCKTQGTWTENAISATQELLSIAQGLKNAEGCGQLATAIEASLIEMKNNLESVDQDKQQAAQMSQVQEEIFANRQYAQDPHLGPIASASMVAGINELAALSTATGTPQSGSPSLNSDPRHQNFLPSLGQKAFQVGRTGIRITDRMIEGLTNEEMKCLASPNLMGPFFTSLVQLTSSMVRSGQDFFGKDVSHLLNKITVLARNTHFDRIGHDLYWLQFQNSVSCLIDTLSEGYCSTLDAQVLFDEEMKRAKPISWVWDYKLTASEQPPTPVDSANYDKLKSSIFEGYYVLTQQLPIVTAFLERIQRGIPPKNHSDANFQNKIQSNTFSYFLMERNILADWNEAKTTISKMTNLDTQKSAIADTLKKLATLIVGGNDDNQGLNFLERVTNPRRVMFDLMGKTMPPEVVGKNGMQIKAMDWLDANYLEFIGDPGAAMAEISKNLNKLLDYANEAAVEYYNYWFIADQPGLMIDSMTGMSYNIPEALEGIRNYLEHFSKQPYVDAAVLPAVYETIDKINRILAQYEKLRETGRTIQSKYGNLDQYAHAQRKEILDAAINQYKDLIEIFYNEFMILKARSSFLVNRLTSVVKIDYQKRLRLENYGPQNDNELLRQIYYATGDVVFERMRLISSKNPAEIDSDLNMAQRTYLETLRALEDLVKDHFIASIARLKMEVEGADTTTSGIFEDSIIRANQDALGADPILSFQLFLSEAIYYGLPAFLKPDSKRAWDYRFSDKIYGTAKMMMNPDRYPGIYALNPVRLFTKTEAPGVRENANGAIQKMWALFCIQSLAFRDQKPFLSLCRGMVLKSPMITEDMRAQKSDIPFLTFLDVHYDRILHAYLQGDVGKLAPPTGERARPELYPDLNNVIDDAQKRLSKNFDARVCALRQRNRNNYIMYLTQGKYTNQH